MTIPETSWEVFDICDKCGVGAKKPCCNLKVSTSRKIVLNSIPHAGRKRLK